MFKEVSQGSSYNMRIYSYMPKTRTKASDLLLEVFILNFKTASLSLAISLATGVGQPTYKVLAQWWKDRDECNSFILGARLISFLGQV